MTGFFGVGGGFVVVPGLVLALGFGMAEAVGTSLLVIALNSVGGAKRGPRWCDRRRLERGHSLYAAAAMAGSVVGAGLAGGPASALERAPRRLLMSSVFGVDWRPGILGISEARGDTTEG